MKVQTDNYDQAETTIQSRGRKTELNRLATAPYYLVEWLVQEFESLHTLAAKKQTVKIAWISSRHTATERTA